MINSDKGMRKREYINITGSICANTNMCNWDYFQFVFQMAGGLLMRARKFKQSWVDPNKVKSIYRPCVCVNSHLDRHGDMHTRNIFNFMLNIGKYFWIVSLLYLGPLPTSTAHHHQSGNLPQSQVLGRRRERAGRPYHQTGNRLHVLLKASVSINTSLIVRYLNLNL